MFRLLKLLNRLTRDTSGNFATMFALSLVPVVASAGAAVDYGRLTLARTELQNAVDAGVLAVNTLTITTSDAAKTVVSDYVQGQLDKGSSLYDLNLIVTLSADGRTLTAQASAKQKTSLMQVVGIRFGEITVNSQVNIGLDNTVELALVLDNTGSMAANNKMTTLKTSATMMIDTLMGDSKNKVKIGIVPFAQYVNVGTANRGAAWLSNTNDYSTSTTTTVPGVCTPASCTTKQDVIGTTNCRTVQTSTTNDGVVTYSTKTQCDNVLGPKYQACTPASCTQTTTKTTTSNYKWYGCVGSRNYPLNLSDDQPTSPWPGLYNTTCGSTVVPLTTSATTLKAAITGMAASGETYLPAGLVWGLNLLSPTQPYTEGQAYDPNKTKPRKVLVFMTDGVNTKSMNSTTAATHTGTNRTLADTYSTTLCATIQAKGIEIYSIALMVDDAAAKTMLQKCASDTSHYYDATDSAALQAAFRKIAYSLQTHYVAR
jgi:Flp pilus assembly protein TadG